jgi:hypothetical protein
MMAINPRRKMWCVLSEAKDPTKGCVIFYDPIDRSWGVGEHGFASGWIQVTGGESSLFSALSGM